MSLLILTFIAGALTILSPCVLPVLPVIIGGSLTDHRKSRPIIITLSLAASVVLFTLLLKWSTALIEIPPEVWTIISGGIILFFGIITLFPDLWEHVSVKLRLSDRSNQALAKSSSRTGLLGAVFVGMSLGPVFASCSPTYALVLATVLPADFTTGLINLISYSLGLAAVLFLIAIFGQAIVNKLKWAADPKGVFKRVLGVIFVVVGLLVMTGLVKDLETYLVQNYDIPAINIELDLLENFDVDALVGDMEKSAVELPADEDTEDLLNLAEPIPAPEIVGIEEWFNSEGETLEDLRGKVVLVDFWTYSCINCIRTLPYLTEWHDAYADDGLVILGIHAPEFAFEKIPANVEEAIEKHEIEYPVGLDNNFSTWRAYNNRYWPAKYFIDKEGNIRHYHFGEGEYEESEEVIRYLLGEDGSEIADDMVEVDADDVSFGQTQTPETYLGYARAENFRNESELVQDETVNYTLLTDGPTDYWSLGGNWQVVDEKSTAQEDGAKLHIQVSAKNVYLVLDGEGGSVQVTVPGNAYGADVNENGTIQVNSADLYHVADFGEFTEDQAIELEFSEGVSAHAFTFGG